MDKDMYMNANYIKTAFKEEYMNSKGESPFGFMIACSGPSFYETEAFWKMVVQNNVKRIVTVA